MRRSRGFTMIETVIFIVVLSIALVGVTLLFGQSVRHSHEPLLRQKAITLASAYMDEILHKKWDENTPTGGGCVNTGSGACTAGPASSGNLGAEPGETRAEYDDVDDYHGLDDAPPVGAGGDTVAGYANYRVAVDVAHPDADWNGIARLDVKRIRVSVQTPLAETIAISAYRVNY